MGKVISMVLIMMILAVIVLEGEAKSEIECSRICRNHCKRTSPVSECAACRKKCYQSPPVAMRARSRVTASEEQKHQ
ncbi:PREDICTED: uncharacterized protein LOC109126606 [Camelina sativa]|uniref:Uncharacterized protein LOC109126606 n=1 Tax=Camelina sativa TaxID=90675 RepID=A0ABM1QGG1_CAMSA|nr:PREDICTED: uncharacterized protein LOC109126606 [Camelina sativa]